jgi:hypothetical protein
VQAKGLRNTVVGVGIIGVCVAILAPRLIDWASRSNPWISVPMGLLAAIGAFFVARNVVRFVIRVRFFRRLLSEPATLAMARKYAGEEGTMVKNGPLTFWYSGPADPVPMFLEQAEVTRVRFEALLGAPRADQPPLRILCFHQRGAFEKHLGPYFSGIDFADLSGFYFYRPCAMCVLCTAESTWRISDPPSTARSLYAHALGERVYGSFPAPWLQAGINKALAAAGKWAGLARLNRKMIASLGRGNAWSDVLFRMPGRTVVKMFRRSNDPKAYQKSQQFTEQSWSIVEYLGGEQAPEARKSAFRAFFKDKRSKGRQEEGFFQYFGFGFGSLLDVWREWVLDQGVGAYEPPPPQIRDALLNRVLPLANDRQAKRWDRIRAVRQWGNAGFALGADAVIDLLREPGEVPKEEVVWALAMVSGMAWDHEPDRWQAWWDDLPSIATASRPDDLETALTKPWAEG